jgi:hypothetical protein
VAFAATFNDGLGEVHDFFQLRSNSVLSSAR